MPIDPSAEPAEPAAAPAPEYVPLSKLPNFDPRVVPVSSIDSHLPSLPTETMSAAALRRRFRDTRAWQPEITVEIPFTGRPITHAAVLVPVVMREQPMVLLTERATHLSTHSGQIAFPGGKCDDTDASVVDTALREAEEEIGLDRRHVEVLGQLPTYTTGTMFVVTPVVALIDPAHTLVINAHEVADAFEVPLAFLMNPAYHHRHRLEWSGNQREWFSMAYMEGTTERFIWGATAAMLRNFYRFLAA